jgi:peptidoglycan/xylan/chitin deacetylase (PgdA/CDA1 family)
VDSGIRENNRHYPVLVYHKIDTKREFGASTISPEKFKEQIRFLCDNGYKSINMTEMLQMDKIPEKYVCIVFDDGYESIFRYALPVLAEHSFTATVGIITNYIGKFNDWDIQLGNKFLHLDMEQMIALYNKGWELASHTCSHFCLTKLNNATLHYELYKSKDKLEKIINSPVNHLIYPFGKTNRQISTIAKQCGYKGASGFYVNKGVDKMFCIKRNAVYSFDRTHSIIRKINHSPYENMKQRVINFWSNGSILLQALNKRNQLEFFKYKLFI